MVSSDALKSMKAMVSDPQKRSLIIKDVTCVGGLVMVLSNPDLNIVKLSLEVLLLLSEDPENRPILRDFIGMLEQLETIATKPRFDEECRERAENLYIHLTESDTTPLKDTRNTHSNRSGYWSSKNKSLTSGRSKTVILQVKGMIDRSDRELCMALLLQVRGVISITFDLIKKRFILRAKQDVRPEQFVQAIARSMTMTAKQVIKNEEGKELLLSFGSNPVDMDKENSGLPDYLPDDVDSPKVDAKAIVREAASSNKGSWLGAAANFLSNSFYW